MLNLLTAAVLATTFWADTCVESGYISRGKINSLDPMLSVDLGMKQELGDFGYVALGLWGIGDLTDCNREKRSPYFAEVDPLVL